MPERAYIKLLIDPAAYAEETGKPLTREELQRQAEFVNEDAATIYGYEAFEFGFETVG